jgi:hypothetical protein
MHHISSLLEEPSPKKLKTTHSSFHSLSFDENNMSHPGAEGTSLDEKSLVRFSRQNAALGADTTAKLIKMKVLIYGLRGVGVETCKNLSLQGVGGLTVRILCSYSLSMTNHFGLRCFLMSLQILHSMGFVFLSFFLPGWFLFFDYS